MNTAEKKRPVFVDNPPEKLSDMKIWIEALIVKYGENAKLINWFDDGYIETWEIRHE